VVKLGRVLPSITRKPPKKLTEIQPFNLHSGVRRCLKNDRDRDFEQKATQTKNVKQEVATKKKLESQKEIQEREEERQNYKTEISKLNNEILQVKSELDELKTLLASHLKVSQWREEFAQEKSSFKELKLKLEETPRVLPSDSCWSDPA